MKNNKLIEECFSKSLELLEKNSSKFGILASSKSDRAVKRNYLSIFGRDASICSLGMVASGDERLIKTARNSLLTLAKYQAPNGQIPNFVKGEKKEADWWYLGCIDATLWWLIAVRFYDQNSKDKKFKINLKKNIDKALGWLDCQKHNSDNLLMQNEASDWADIMPRSGKVLYTNALWLKILKDRRSADFKVASTNFSALFNPFSFKKNSLISNRNLSLIEYIKSNSKKTEHYLSFVNYRFWGDDIDVYANSLAIIFGLLDGEKSEVIIKKLLKKKSLKNLPMPVLFNPIKRGGKNWREFMETNNQNYPFQYHDGGIWPFASAFWAIALFKAGCTKEAWEEMEKIAQANKINNWQFNEWFHAKTGKPMGMAGQSWNAGAFVFAYQYLNKKIKLF